MATGLCQSSVGGDAAWLLLQGICSREPLLEINPNYPACAFVHDLFLIVNRKMGQRMAHSALRLLATAPRLDFVEGRPYRFAVPLMALRSCLARNTSFFPVVWSSSASAASARAYCRCCCVISTSSPTRSRSSPPNCA